MQVFLFGVERGLQIEKIFICSWFHSSYPPEEEGLMDLPPRSKYVCIKLFISNNIIHILVTLKTCRSRRVHQILLTLLSLDSS